MAEVVLHIGAFKTGTSFIQNTMARNKAALAEAGLLFPGQQWPDQIQAVRELAARQDPTAPVEARGEDAWDRLAAECLHWDGHRAVVSMEYLSAARADVVRAAVASFAPATVRIVLGARDLTYAIPAQWQESLQSGGRTWTLSEYATDVMRPVGQFSPATRHFWQKHNWQRILGRWNEVVPRERLTVLTFPRPGSDPSVLWHRFGAAAGFDATAYPMPEPRNESLGAASLEVARRVNLAAVSQGLTTRRNVVYRRVLCKNVMASRRRSEDAVVLPEQCRDWVENRTRQILGKVERVGPAVVGDLGELIPQPYKAKPDTTWSPESLPAASLLAAAETAVEGLARALGEPAPAIEPSSEAERLRSAISSLLAMVEEESNAPA